MSKLKPRQTDRQTDRPTGRPDGALRGVTGVTGRHDGALRGVTGVFVSKIKNIVEPEGVTESNSVTPDAAP